MVLNVWLYKLKSGFIKSRIEWCWNSILLKIFTTFSFCKYFEPLCATESKPQAVHLTYLHLADAPKDMSGVYKC